MSPLRATLASPFDVTAAARGITAGLRSADWAVEEIDTNAFSPMGQSLARRIERRLRARFDQAAVNAAVRESIAHCRSEVLLVVKGVGIASETLRWARSKGVYTVNYWPDYRIPDDARERFSAYDLFVTTKQYQVDTLSRWLSPERVALVHHGYAPGVHRPLGLPQREEDYSTDVCYVGNATAYKARYLTALAQALPDCAMRVFGCAWEPLATGTALARAVVGRQAVGDYMALELSRSRINLALHMGPDPRTGWEDRVSMRSFEIPACGGFMLHIDNEEVRSLYRVPDEIDTFASIDELVAKTRYYLDHPAERRAIAERGHARAVPAYSYHQRGVELARIIAERSAARPQPA